MQVGIVLAGGLATRLPNKVLLPMKDMRPAIFSSIELFKRSKVSNIVVVIPPNSVIPDVLGNDFMYVIQDEARGVPDAIEKAKNGWASAMGDIDVHFHVSCADNVYHSEEIIDEKQLTADAAASVRLLPPFVVRHLSRYSPKRKQFVTAAADAHAPCVAGVMSFYGPAFVPEVDTVRWLNAMKAKPFAYAGPWWDIGTVETYAAYWRTPCGASC